MCGMDPTPDPVSDEPSTPLAEATLPLAAPSPANPATVVLRVWLPDRPGALGAVASRIGAVRGDVVAIDVLERGGGQAVDELTVVLPDEGLIELLVAEVGEVDGVAVEDVHLVPFAAVDRQVAALRAAVAVASAPDAARVHDVLCQEAAVLFEAEWVAVLDVECGAIVSSVGSPVPHAAWLTAFATGVDYTVGPGTIDDLTFCGLDGESRCVVLSRPRLPLREVERDALTELAALAARRHGELSDGGRRIGDQLVTG